MTTLTIPIGFVGTLPLTLKDANGAALNYTGATVRVTLKRSTSDPAPLWSKTTTNGGITQTNPGSGEAGLVLTDADWAGLTQTEVLIAEAEIEWTSPARRERVNWKEPGADDEQFLLPVVVVARLSA